MNTHHIDSRYPICERCHKRQYERGQTYTPGDNCECSTNHTDSVEAGTRIATIIMDGKINGTSANEITRQVLEVHSQQVEEAVRQERERIRTIIQPQIDSANTSQSYAPGSSERYAYENGSKTAAMYIQEALNKALTPNHQN